MTMRLMLKIVITMLNSGGYDGFRAEDGENGGSEGVEVDGPHQAVLIYF